MGIHSLPLDLLEKIYRHLDPAFHLGLALVDKHIFNLSQHIIERHQKYYHSFRTSSDQDLRALFTQLRAVAVDHAGAGTPQAQLEPSAPVTESPAKASAGNAVTTSASAGHGQQSRALPHDGSGEASMKKSQNFGVEEG